jgi:hypothetical protein
MIDKVGYVAGPFRAPNHWEIELNIRHAETLALKVWAMGAPALCPHSNTRFYQGVLPDDTWLDGDLFMLKRCDFIVMTHTWKKSSGAVEEHTKAKEWGIKVFYETRAGAIPKLRRWLANA